MKILLSLGALLLSSAPASADDLLYLKCDERRVLTSTVTFGEDEQVPLESDNEELFVLSIDTKNKKMLVTGAKLISSSKMAKRFIQTCLTMAMFVMLVLSPRCLSPARYGQGKVVSKEPFLHVTDVDQSRLRQD